MGCRSRTARVECASSAWLSAPPCPHKRPFRCGNAHARKGALTARACLLGCSASSMPFASGRSSNSRKGACIRCTHTHACMPQGGTSVAQQADCCFVCGSPPRHRTRETSHHGDCHRPPCSHRLCCCSLLSMHTQNYRRTRTHIDGQKSTKNSETNLTKCYARTTSHSVHTTAGARPARRLRPVVRAAQATRS